MMIADVNPDRERCIQMKKEKYIGIAPGDDDEIRIIEDLTTLHGYSHQSGGIWYELRSPAELR